MSKPTPAYRKRWNLDRHRGQLRLIDPEPARAHIAYLLSHGHAIRGIADTAGISTTQVANIAARRHPKAQRTVVAKILAVTSADIYTRGRPDGYVPSIGAKRRIQALYAIGHTAHTLAAHLDVHHSFLHNTVNQRGHWITRARRDLIVTAYNDLWNTPGTSTKNRAEAARRGWVPPLAWDDDTIDDPRATPNTGTSRHRAADLLDDLTDLAANSSCLRCGIQHSTRRNSTGVCFDCQETDPDYAAALVAARPERTPSR